MNAVNDAISPFNVKTSAAGKVGRNVVSVDGNDNVARVGLQELNFELFSVENKEKGDMVMRQIKMEVVMLEIRMMNF